MIDILYFKDRDAAESLLQARLASGDQAELVERSLLGATVFAVRCAAAGDESFFFLYPDRAPR